MVMQNGQALAMVFAPVSSSCNVRFTFTRLLFCSSIHIWAPPAPQHSPFFLLVEAETSKKKGLCCGAGGAQMWMEEQNSNRVNVKRTLQLLDTGAKTIASACPFCMTMLSDGVKSQSKEDA